MTLVQTLTFALGFTLCGFTLGIIVMDIKFLRPMQNLVTEALTGWKSTLEALEEESKDLDAIRVQVDEVEKLVEGLPTKSPIQIKHDK